MKISGKFLGNLGIYSVLVLIYIFLFRLLYPPLYEWWVVPALVQKKVLAPPSVFGRAVWILVGMTVFCLCVQNRAKIIGWFTAGSWKATRWWVGGAALLALTVWAIVVGDWSAWFATVKTEAALFWRFVVRPYCWWIVGGLVLLWLIIRLTGRATTPPTTGGTTVKPRESLKKTVELLTALAKLGALIALTVVLFIFIVGPRMFWRGNYTPPPPTPVGGAQAAPAVPATPVPQSRPITIPVGDLNAPLTQWSEEIRVVPGWSFRWDIMGQGGKIGVLVDGTTRVVNEPTRRTDTHATQSLRFIALEGRPMKIVVSYYR